MRKIFYLIVLTCLLSLNVTAAPTVAQENTCNPEYNQADVNYLQSMIEHHRGAVEMAEKVPHHTNRTELTNISDQIIRVQEAEIAHMQGLINESCVQPNVDEDKHIAPTQRQVDYLKSLNGTEFDLMFINLMAAHHTDAEIESNIILKEGESEKVEELARDVIEAQTAEIEQMYKWYVDWN